MASTIKGGPELKARLEAAAGSGIDIQDEWAHVAADRMRGSVSVRTGRLRQSIQPGWRRQVAAVLGAFYGVILDRGSKAHEIKGRNTPTRTLKFDMGGRTIFAKRVHHRRMPRRPFATAAAQDAMRDSRVYPDALIKAWNRKRARSGFRKIAL